MQAHVFLHPHSSALNRVDIFFSSHIRVCLPGASSRLNLDVFVPTCLSLVSGLLLVPLCSSDFQQVLLHVSFGGLDMFTLSCLSLVSHSGLPSIPLYLLTFGSSFCRLLYLFVLSLLLLHVWSYLVNHVFVCECDVWCVCV